MAREGLKRRRITITNIFFIIGVVSFGISGVMLGAWTGGQRQRDYYQAEDINRRNGRLKRSMLFAFVGILSFAVAGFMHY